MYALSGACRYVWNHYVSKLKDEFECNGSSQWKFKETSRQFTLSRRHVDTWLQEYSCNIVRFSLKPIELNYKKFFKVQGGLPKFKSKWKSCHSFPLTIGQTGKIDGEWLYIQKLGYVRLSGSNPYSEAIAKTVTVKEECGHWYAYVVYAVEVFDEPHSLETVGVDRNAGQVALSDGRIFHAPDVSALERKKNKYQRQMSRRQKPDRKKDIKASNRYRTARGHYRDACQKIRHVNDNWNHQVSRHIANDYDVVVLEDLKINNMVKSAKGTVENPGKRVSQKKGLNKAILKTGWYKLEQMLSYKSSIRKVGPHYTSQTCHECGHVDKRNRETQALFKCMVCGHSDNADVNAARNIRALGNGVLRRGGLKITLPVKRHQTDFLTPVKLSL